MKDESKCAACGSTEPHLHPATQHGGEVEICGNEFHLAETPQNKSEWIRCVEEKLDRRGRQ